MKLVARLQGYIIPVFTAWHRIAGIKLHHSLNHVLCHPEFLAPFKYRSGHPKLMQIETPLVKTKLYMSVPSQCAQVSHNMKGCRRSKHNLDCSRCCHLFTWRGVTLSHVSLVTTRGLFVTRNADRRCKSAVSETMQYRQLSSTDTDRSFVRLSNPQPGRFPLFWTRYVQTKYETKNNIVMR